jgi:hypothetical protein
VASSKDGSAIAGMFFLLAVGRIVFITPHPSQACFVFSSGLFHRTARSFRIL